jgi:uncharacterized protein with ParB-like and HNH nuclease domain
MKQWIDLKLVMKNGKLVPINKKENRKFEIFKESLKEGEIIDLFIARHGKEKSLAQLAKAHACIREIALESGQSFDEIKNYIKAKVGLELDNDTYMSFADCTSDQMTLVIQECIDLGKDLNLNLY